MYFESCILDNSGSDNVALITLPLGLMEKLTVAREEMNILVAFLILLVASDSSFVVVNGRYDTVLLVRGLYVTENCIPSDLCVSLILLVAKRFVTLWIFVVEIETILRELSVACVVARSNSCKEEENTPAIGLLVSRDDVESAGKFEAEAWLVLCLDFRITGEL